MPSSLVPLPLALPLQSVHLSEDKGSAKTELSSYPSTGQNQCLPISHGVTSQLLPVVLPLPSSLTLSPKAAPAAPRTHPVTLHQAFCLCCSHCLESSVLRGLAASVRHSCLRANVTFSEPPSLATLSDVAFPHSCSALGTYCRTLCSCL